MKKVLVAFDGQAVCLAEVADNPWTRMRGLLGRGGLEQGRGIWIRPCKSVHTFFMRFSIDVVYLSREGTVTRTRSDLRPFRLSGGKRGTHSVLELPAGSVEKLHIAVGQTLLISPFVNDEAAISPSTNGAGLAPKPPVRR